MKRTALYLVLFLAIALSSTPPTKAQGAVAADDSLLFPKDKYTEETISVRTSRGERTVAYHSYRHILYVAKPVDKDYESLDVSVPVKVDGRTVDATSAPILFIVPVGGYMSASNAGQGGSSGSMGGLALAAGYVVVTPGCRGRDNKAPDGTYYGKAPAAIVDLKAAVRYIRHNAGVMPGNTNWIVATGSSAGGALTSLLGASGNSHLYDAYLKEIGVADAKDNIYAAAPFCPITDLEHADMAYEWMYGAVPTGSGLQDQELSRQLKNAFVTYQASLKLQGKNGFGSLTADKYDKYLLKTYLFPAANRYLRALTEEGRKEYLEKNKWIAWADNAATFSFADFLTHVGRMKSLPAFDDFDMKKPEPNEFGNKTTDSRHFTNFSLRHTTGNPNAKVDDDIPALLNLMNPMHLILQNNPGMAGHWWIRHGTSDNHTSLTVITNLAVSLENRKKDVNYLLYWDAGHGANEDAEDFVAWIGKITRFTSRN